MDVDQPAGPSHTPTTIAPNPAPSVNASYVIIVTNIHEEATEEDVFDAFADYGDILALHLNQDRRTGYIKGYALIQYADKSEGEEAIRDMNGQELLKRQLAVDWAFVDGPLPRKPQI
jgi:RNA-binding protein 8A